MTTPSCGAPTAATAAGGADEAVPRSVSVMAADPATTQKAHTAAEASLSPATGSAQTAAAQEPSLPAAPVSTPPASEHTAAGNMCGQAHSTAICPATATFAQLRLACPGNTALEMLWSVAQEVQGPTADPAALQVAPLLLLWADVDTLQDCRDSFATAGPAETQKPWSCCKACSSCCNVKCLGRCLVSGRGNSQRM